MRPYKKRYNASIEQKCKCIMSQAGFTITIFVCLLIFVCARMDESGGNEIFKNLIIRRFEGSSLV